MRKLGKSFQVNDSRIRIASYFCSPSVYFFERLPELLNKRIPGLLYF